MPATFPADEKKTLWVEATEISAALRDIALKLTFRRGEVHEDIVKATGVWSELSKVRHERNDRVLPRTLDRQWLRDEIEQKAVAVDGSLYGIGPHERRTMPMVHNTRTGGRILLEFTIKPKMKAKDVEDLGVCWDVTRQLWLRRYTIEDAKHEVKLTGRRDFPDRPIPIPPPPPPTPDPVDNETPNDAGMGVCQFDDNSPNEGKIYSFDSPSDVLSANEAFYIRRNTFMEWTRIRIHHDKPCEIEGPPGTGPCGDGVTYRFVDQDGLVEGSRAADKDSHQGDGADWHYIDYLVRDEHGHRAHDILFPAPWIPRPSTHTVSYPLRKPGNTGDGAGVTRMQGTSGPATEGFTAEYDLGSQEWTLTGTRNPNNPIRRRHTGPIPHGTQWVFYLSGRFDLIITQGATAFDTGDEFEFSTFISTLKTNEIKQERITPTDGP